MNLNIDERYDFLIEKSFDNARGMIKYKYIDNINIRTLNKWIDNFQSRDEKYLSAAILNSLIFRSEESVKSLGADIFQIMLPQILEQEGIYKASNIKDWIKLLNGRNCKSIPIRFTAIDDVDNKAVKSSSVILNTLQKLFFDSTLGINSHSITQTRNNNIKAIVLFDDIIGTGSQFESFFTKRKLHESDIKFIYIPFSAINKTYLDLEKKFDNLVIKPVEIIDESHGFFTKENKMLRAVEGLTEEDFKKFYLHVCKSKGICINGNLGYGGFELTYLFSKSTPNNNISMIIHKDENWNELFKR